MIFFAVVAIATQLARLADRLGLPGLADWPSRMRWGMATALLLFGTDHLLIPARYLPMLPEALPWREEIILFTGLCEIAGAVGLLIPRLRRLAGILLAIYFVCVFPANIRNALQGLSVNGLPGAGWYYWVRLAFQPVAVWWALRAAEVIPAPRPRAARVQRA